MAEVTNEVGVQEKVSKEVETTTGALRYWTLKLLSSGHYEKGISDAKKMDLVTRYVMLNIFLVVGIGIFLPFTINLAMQPGADPMVIVADALFCLLLAFLFFLTHTKIPVIVPSIIMVGSYTAFVCFMIISHSSGGVAAALWALILPSLAYYILGQLGSIPSFIVLGVMLYTFYTDSAFYYYDFALRTAILYTFMIAFSSLSYNRTQVLSLALTRSRTQLQNEFNEIETMKDNLEVGIFMLDADFIFQPFFSKHTPQVFDREDLKDLDFFVLLKGSLVEKEIQLLKDFLEMVLHSSYDPEMLRDVNPLYRFTYLTPNAEKKILSITFSHIIRQNGDDVILAVARDITYEIELEEKLEREEQFRQAEMKSMFEVMHVPPQSLSEFLDEVDDEFSRMNEALKDDARPKLDVYKDLFQGLHAMKSNALVIGLETPAARFHEFEDKVATLLRDKIDTYESMLEIVFELERIMEIVDGLKNIVKKMELYSESSSAVNSSSNILVQALQNAVNKVKSAGDKNAVIKVKKLDWDGISKDYRRVIKEILLQLTRNSMAHGIEDFTDRNDKGKSENGILSLSIELDETKSKIIVEFSDDGAGINFEQVRKQAIEKKILPATVTKEDRNMLIKAIFSPGFSTAESLSLQAGRGIGLSLVSSRIKEYKGHITVKSAPNHGTKFVIEFPYNKTA